MLLNFQLAGFGEVFKLYRFLQVLSLLLSIYCQVEFLNWHVCNWQMLRRRCLSNTAHIFLIEHCVFRRRRKWKHSIYIVQSVKGAFRLGARVPALSAQLVRGGIFSQGCFITRTQKSGYLVYKCLQPTKSRNVSCSLLNLHPTPITGLFVSNQKHHIMCAQARS